MKKLLFFVFVLCTLNISAQNARSILDKASSKIAAAGQIKFTFDAAQFRGTTPDTQATGTMITDGKRYHINTDDLLVWYNGKETWTLLKGSNEVNISTPTPEEQTATNIHTLINIYKSGYKMSVKNSTVLGTSTYEVHLTAKNKKQGFEELYINVSTSTYLPVSIRAKKSGNWMRLRISNFHGGQTFSETQFSFPKQQYPDIEVIDLR